MTNHSNSLWFLIGAQLLIYGIIIEATGLWEIAHPPVQKVDLAYTHPAIWWGGAPAGAGLVLCYSFQSTQGQTPQFRRGTAVTLNNCDRDALSVFFVASLLTGDRPVCDTEFPRRLLEFPLERSVHVPNTRKTRRGRNG